MGCCYSCKEDSSSQVKQRYSPNLSSPYRFSNSLNKIESVCRFKVMSPTLKRLHIYLCALSSIVYCFEMSTIKDIVRGRFRYCLFNNFDLKLKIFEFCVE